MTTTRHSRLIILGSGPAGYSAAVYAARANRAPLLITGVEQGGQLMTTTDVDNWPGDVEGLQGPALMERMRRHAERFATDIVNDHVQAVDLGVRPFRLRGDARSYSCDALIIATGATARYLGLPSEERFRGRGVSACATCDGFFFSGKEIVVIGGGDSAMEEALFLTRFASKVTLIHRRGSFRASKIMLDRAQHNDKIQFLTDTVVEDVYDPALHEVTGLKLRNLKTDKVSDFPTSAMFLGIGHEPNAKMFAGQLDTDADGYLKTHNYVMTRAHGVFACGDVQDRRYRQAITAAGTGCMAAIEVEKFLEEHGT